MERKFKIKKETAMYGINEENNLIQNKTYIVKEDDTWIFDSEINEDNASVNVFLESEDGMSYVEIERKFFEHNFKEVN